MSPSATIWVNMAAVTPTYSAASMRERPKRSHRGTIHSRPARTSLTSFNAETFCSGPCRHHLSVQRVNACCVKADEVVREIAAVAAGHVFDRAVQGRRRLMPLFEMLRQLQPLPLIIRPHAKPIKFGRREAVGNWCVSEPTYDLAVL